MPIPGFSLVPPPEFIAAAEAVGMVMERFKSSACTEAEACGWLTEQVRQGELKLLWTTSDPEFLFGLHLTEESFIYIPNFPGALALDEFDWGVGELRRRLRVPKPAARQGRDIEPLNLTTDEALARYGYRTLRDEPEPRDESEEWNTEELTYRFTVRRTALVATLDRATVPLGTVPVPLAEAGEVIAGRFKLSLRIGLHTIVEAAAAGRIEVYGKAPSKWQKDCRIGREFWLTVTPGEADALAGDPGNRGWSDPYVFRGDLERLLRELAGWSAAVEIEGNPTEAAAAECTAEGAVHAGEPEEPRRRFRGDKGKVWEAAQRHGRPDFSQRGAIAEYVRRIARETGVKETTVRNYVTKQAELRIYIKQLPKL